MSLIKWWDGVGDESISANTDNLHAGDYLVMIACDNCGEEHYFEPDNLPGGVEHCPFCEECCAELPKVENQESKGRRGMKTLQAEVTKWAHETFPGETHESKLIHLFEEISEIFFAVKMGAITPKIMEECADAAMITLNLASGLGVTLPEPGTAFDAEIRRKLEINRGREWGQGKDGVFRHIPTSATRKEATKCEQ